MRTRSAEKRTAGKPKTPTAAASAAAAELPEAEQPAETKRTPTARAKQTKSTGSATSSPAEVAKPSDVDGAVQSTPEAKTPSGRKTTRKVVKKVVKKIPVSSRPNSKKTPTSTDAGMAVLEDPPEEEKREDSKEDPVKEFGKEGNEDHMKGEAVEEFKGSTREEETEDLKGDPRKVEETECSKEDPVKEQDIEGLKEDDAKMNDAEADTEESKVDTAMKEGAEDSKEDPIMVEDAEGSKEDAVKDSDAYDSKKDSQNLKEDPVEEVDAEDTGKDPVKVENAKDTKENAEGTKEDPVKEKYAENLNDAETTSMYDSDPEETEEPSNDLEATAQTVGDVVMEDQNGNVEGQVGNAPEDTKPSENQEYVTKVKSQEGEGSVIAKQELELRGEEDSGAAPTGDTVGATSAGDTAQDRMEEDTDKKMKGKDISLDEADEDRIEAFADQEPDEEFGEDDVPEHSEEAETLEDERAQLNALAKERMKRKEVEIFVGGLDRDAVEEDVKRVFQHVGEVVDVRMHREASSNKNKGYAFVKFATKEQASRALSEMRNPVIRGKRCGTAPSEDNDTLFLGNICNTWTKEAVRQKLKDYGVEGLENINLVPDLKHEGLSRGFAFLEFSCHAVALTAYKRLQKPDVVFGHSERTVKVAFAEPLRDPDPDVMAQVKSVFIDGLPPYWDEDRVREKFKSFGEIARITLARNMSTAKRKDFGFVDFSTHEAAVACIEGINNTELGDGNLKAKVRARLSNPLPKTQAVKGGMSGGFRISRGAMGRGFPRGGHTIGRANFPRGRGFHPRGPGHSGVMDFAEHEFGSTYPPSRGRSNFGRGGRWNFSGPHPASDEGPMFLDRTRHGGRGHVDDAFFRRQQFPVEGPNRPFLGRHFEDRYSYDNTDHRLKRPFSMTDPDPDYLGPSRRPRFGHSDAAVSLPGDRYRDNFPPGADRYPRDYYGSDYRGRGQYPSFYGADRPYGRGYGRGYY